MDKHQLVDTISTQTGISKRDLSLWIGTHHSILSRYLAGTRSLPLKAVQQLLFLHQYLSELPPLPPATPTAENKNEWQEQAQTCQQKLSSLQDRYAEMQLSWQAASKALQLLEVLFADTVTLTPQKQRWIEEQRYLAGKQLAENGVVAQKKLSIQIALLQKEIELCEGLVREGYPNA